MVKFDHKIDPGQSGKISLSVVTEPSWGGERFTKRALVVTNDPKSTRFMLTLSGYVAPADKPEAKPPAKPEAKPPVASPGKPDDYAK